MYRSREEFENKHGIDRHRFLTLWALGMSDTELAVSLDISPKKVKTIKDELHKNHH
ncbi:MULTISPECIES: hypothetical protein [unclassified Candidatus Frackibacter]|uniref:hypothetical protein n=1 Tax=unclassified Candidatus Frackibacter TaxID=2648818 RepID=UPI0007926CC6|nr:MULTISPECIES: hypothetical protein [unclassified Candidatus Frackibacter]KXS45827.1 MAG: hypothetical protein AWU54_118 [Candidatus Frackibacter sp. T328-2]SDC54356.1 hypothetical protein SAMN04515661_11342 [Candidatus Frackibacter sp. WG11]SEM66567.1 hypothetical protein SAMN04488698_11142 [Candidatus Frackibacter sp. WG12]SFL77890.1 hypothetical protein SAMN04488699_11342 [Candidatus Frackibacter sp. WG13]